MAKVNATGNALTYAGYIGGAKDDVGTRIALDPAGNAYITGGTTSSEASFPVTVGPSLTFGGNGSGICSGANAFSGSDAFVAKINAAGSSLIYCGYIGGNCADTGTGIAVDTFGNAYVTGSTTSNDFPVVDGPGATLSGGNLFGDAFVARVNASGTALDYSGYIGGDGEDIGTGIAVDNAGNAYVTGGTNSTEADFSSQRWTTIDV